MPEEHLGRFKDPSEARPPTDEHTVERRLIMSGCIAYFRPDEVFADERELDWYVRWLALPSIKRVHLLYRYSILQLFDGDEGRFYEWLEEFKDLVQLQTSRSAPVDFGPEGE